MCSDFFPCAKCISERGGKEGGSAGEHDEACIWLFLYVEGYQATETSLLKGFCSYSTAYTRFLTVSETGRETHTRLWS